jgi:hypothetical protein
MSNGYEDTEKNLIYAGSIKTISLGGLRKMEDLTGFKGMNLMKIIIFLLAFNSQMENQFKQMEELIMQLQDVIILVLEL